MDYQKLFESGIQTESVRAWRAQGKKALGVLCCHVPEEILYALDVLPVRMRATGCTESPSADAWMSNISCSYARGMLEYWINGTYELDGIVTSDGCMMVARCFDNAEHISKGKPMYFREVGAPRAIMGHLSYEYYLSELQDLVTSLEEYTGNKLTDEKLKAAALKINEARALVREVYELRKADKPVISGEECLNLTLAYCDVPVDEYIAMVKAFLADAGNRKPVEDVRARLMVIGSALDNAGYLKIIEDKGGLVVTDSLCYGFRSFAEDIVFEGDNLLKCVADFYLNRLLCPRMMDNRLRGQDMIVEKCKEFKVDGVIYQKMQYCECWGGESLYLEPRLKELGIPMIQLDREEHLANAGQLSIRAEAFIEMIEN